MKLETMEYFIQIVECGSFNQAAKQLYISQPGLTRAINLLEKELNRKLLKRSNKGIVPTESGKEFYQDCKEIMSFIQEKESKWYQNDPASNGDDITGNVYILALPAMFSFLLNDLVFQMKKEYPGINIYLREISEFDFLKELQTSNINIGLSSCFMEDKNYLQQKTNSMQLDCEFMCEDQYAVFMSSRNPFANQESISVEACKTLPLVVLTSDNTVAPKVTDLFHSEALYYLSSKESMYQYIMDDKAVSVFLDKMHRNSFWVKNGYIQPKLLSEQPLLPSLHYMVTTKANTLSPAEQLVVQRIRETYLQLE